MDVVVVVSLVLTLLTVAFAVGSFRSMLASRHELVQLKSDISEADGVSRQLLDDIYESTARSLKPDDGSNVIHLDTNVFLILAHKEINSWTMNVDEYTRLFANDISIASNFLKKDFVIPLGAMKSPKNFQSTSKSSAGFKEFCL